jgi:hypothetical protein
MELKDSNLDLPRQCGKFLGPGEVGDQHSPLFQAESLYDVRYFAGGNILIVEVKPEGKAEEFNTRIEQHARFVEMANARHLDQAGTLPDSEQTLLLPDLV